MKVAAIIPARYASTRFPAKLLADLGGKPLLQWVWEAVSGTGLFSEVLIATDSPLILAAVSGFGGRAVLTGEGHASGTDRVAEAAGALDAGLIINVQGDEPLIRPDALASLLGAFVDPAVEMASLMAPLADPERIRDPNAVKVVTDSRSDALYFSRSAIPHDRDGSGYDGYRLHVGVYAYRRETLLRFVSLPQGNLERVEKLEQLRALEHGIPIRMVETDFAGVGVDTPADLERVKEILRERRS